MFESIQSLMDTFPEAVVQVRGGAVTGANAAARHYLPQLETDGPLPEFLELPCSAAPGSGVFTQGPFTYAFTASPAGEGLLILFRPAPQTVLTGRQLDGVIRQLRELLGELLGGVSAPEGGEEGALLAHPAFSRSFHRLFRLVNNLEYMQESGGGSVVFRPVTMDLDGLCRQLASEAYDLLRAADVTLEYECPARGLLIPGDPLLLQRMLLGLIANGARAAEGGRVVLALRRQRNRALLTLSDSGPLLDRRQLAAMLQDGGGPDIPLPGQGAGLGLSIVRSIVSLHRGEMIISLDQSAPVVMISLPTGPLEARTALRTPPPPQRDGGLSPVMVELSDVLPARLFRAEEMD